MRALRLAPIIQVLLIKVSQSVPLQNSRYKLTSSTAVIAASNPLLPDFAPARSIACSRLSAVTTPRVMGRFVSRETWAMPLMTSAAMYSLWEVSPRITTPRQITASYSSLSAARLAAIGSSKEPGTRMMVIASLEAPSLSSASVAPPINRLTMKSFQRLATIATLIPSALSRPWIVLANQPLSSSTEPELRRSLEHRESNIDSIAPAIFFNHQLCNEY